MPPWPQFSELVGGMLTAAGLAYPLGPVAIAGAMAVATAAHSDKGAMGQTGGFELPLIDLVAALALALVGPGRYSLDAVIGRREQPEPATEPVAP